MANGDEAMIENEFSHVYVDYFTKLFSTLSFVVLLFQISTKQPLQKKLSA